MKREEEPLVGDNTTTTAPTMKSKANDSNDSNADDDNDDILYDDINDFLSQDLQRMGSEADAILDSIRNEALPTPEVQKRTRRISLPCDSDDEQYYHDDNEDDVDVNHVVNTQMTTTTRRTSLPSSPSLPQPSNKKRTARRKTPSYEHSDTHDDDEEEEMRRLNEVVLSIRQEVDAQSVESMTSALSNLDGRSYRYSKHTVLSNTQDFWRKHHELYGPVGKDRSTPLLIMTLLIWTVVFALLWHVQYGQIDDESGQFRGMPEIVQKLVDRLL